MIIWCRSWKPTMKLTLMNVFFCSQVNSKLILCVWLSVMHGSITLLPSPRATPGTGPALRAREWLKRSYPEGREWGKSKVTSLIFAKYGLFLELFARRLYFQGKRHKFAGEWIKRNKKAIKIKVCIWRYVLKLQMNLPMMRTRMDIFCKRNKEIFLQPTLIIRQLK